MAGTGVGIAHVMGREKVVDPRWEGLADKSRNACDFHKADARRAISGRSDLLA